MTRNQFLKVFVYVLLCQFFVTNTVLAVGWQGIVGRDWDEDLYDSGISGRSLRVEVLKTPRMDEDVPFSEDAERGISLFVHGIDHGTRSHEFLVAGTVFDFKGGVTRQKVKTAYEGGTLEFWIGKDGSIELSRLDTPYALDFITTGDVILQESLSREKIRIGARSFRNQGTLRARSLLEIYTTGGDIVNTGVIEAAEIRIQTMAAVLNKSGWIIGQHINIQATTIENHWDSLLSATRLVELVGDSLILSQSTLLATQGVFNLKRIHLRNRSILNLKDCFDFKGDSYRSEEFSLLRAGTIDIDVEEFQNLRRSQVKSDERIKLAAGRFSNAQGNIESKEDVYLTHRDEKEIVDEENPLQLGFPIQRVFSNEEGQITASGRLHFDTGDWDINLESGALVAGHDLLLEGWSIFNNGGKIVSPQIQIQAHDLRNGIGEIQGDEVVINLTTPALEVIGACSLERCWDVLQRDLTAGLLVNEGLIEAAHLLTIRVGGFLGNMGSIGGYGRVEIESGFELYNALGGSIYAGRRDFALAGASLRINSRGHVINKDEWSSFYSAGEITVTSQQKDIMVKEGAQIDGDSVTLQAKDTIHVSEGGVTGERSISLKTTSSEFGQGNVLLQQGQLISRAGDIQVKAAGSFNSYGKSRIEGEGVFLEALKTVANIYDSQVEARDSLTVKGETFNNSQGRIRARKVLIEADRKENLSIERRLGLSSNPFSPSRRYVQRQGTESSSPPPPTESVPEEEAKADKALHEEEKAGGEGDKTSEASSKKEVAESHAGHVINPGGHIEGTEEVVIISLGDVYNSDGAVIRSPEGRTNIQAVGRILNQDRSEIRARENLEIKAARGVVLNTEGSLFEGKTIDMEIGMSMENSGTEGALGRIFAKELLSIRSKGNIYNKQGHIISGGILTLLIEEALENDQGLIRGLNMDLSSLHRLYNREGSVLEGLESFVLPSHKFLLQNDGRIYSREALTFPEIAIFLDESGEIIAANQKGTIESDSKILFEGEGSFPKKIRGKLIAPEIQFISSTLSRGSKASYNFAELIMDTTFQTDRLRFEFPGLNISLEEDLVLPFGFEAHVKRWINKKRLKVLAGQIRIHSLTDIINWVNYSSAAGEPNFYPLNYDSRFKEDTGFDLLSDEGIHFHKGQRASEAFFEAEEGVLLEAGGIIRNYGGVTSGSDIILKAPFVQHGWAEKDDQVDQLEDGDVRREVFDWRHHYFKPQDVYMRAAGVIHLDSPGGKFLNVFGRIRAGRGFSARARLFLNFAGDIVVDHQPDDLNIETEIFLNTLGLIETSIIPRRYWSISFANTGPSFFNVLDGSLQIKASYLRNTASFIHGETGVFLNGVRVDAEASEDKQLTSVINEHAQLAFTRTVTTEGTSVSYTKNRVCGINTGKSKSEVHWRHHYPETASLGTLMGTISAGGGVEITGFDRAEQRGLVHGNYTILKAGERGISHGYQRDIRLPQRRPVASRIDLLSSFESDQSQGRYIQDRSGEFGFLHPAAGGMGNPLYFTLLSEHLPESFETVRLVLPPYELAAVYHQTLQRQLGTGRIASLPDFATGTRQAYESAETYRSFRLDQNPYLGNLATVDTEIRVVSPRQVKQGVYFELRKIEDQTLAFPVLYLNPSLLPSAVFRVDGSTVGDGAAASAGAGSKAGTVVLETPGEVELTGGVYGEYAVDIYGGKGVYARTRTHSERVGTKRLEGKQKGGRWSQKTEVKEVIEFGDVTVAEDPTTIETGSKGWTRIRAGKRALLALPGIDIRAGTGGVTLSAEEGHIEADALETAELYHLSHGTRSSGIRRTFRPAHVQTEGDVLIGAEAISANGIQLMAGGDVYVNAMRLRMAALESRYVAEETLDILNRSFDAGIRSSVTHRSDWMGPHIESRHGDIHLTGGAAGAGGIVELEGRVAALEGGIDISGGKGVFLTAVETESETGTRIQAPVIYDSARYDVETRSTSFNRIGIKGTSAKDEDETWGRVMRSHHVSRGTVSIGDKTAQEIHLQAPHIDARHFIATVDEETGQLILSDARDYYIRQTVSRSKRGWGTADYEQEGLFHQRSVGALIDTTEGSHLSGSTIDLTHVGFKGLGRHILDGRKIAYRLGREESEYSYAYSSPGMWWQEMGQEWSRYSRPISPVLGAPVDIWADNVMLEYPMGQDSYLNPFTVHRGHVVRSNVPIIYDSQSQHYSGLGIGSQALLAIAAGMATGGIGSGWGSAFMAGAAQGASAAGITHAVNAMVSGEDPFSRNGLQQIVLAAVTQGLISEAMQGVQGVLSIPKGQSLADATRRLLDPITFAEHVTRAGINVGISTGVNWAVQGGKGRDVLTQAGLSIAAATAGSYGAYRIGQSYKGGHIKYGLHKALHFMNGGLAAALIDREDPMRSFMIAGASAAGAEMGMEWMFPDVAGPVSVSDSPVKVWDARESSSVLEQRQYYAHQMMRALSVIGAATVGGNPFTADTAADTAIRNNTMSIFARMEEVITDEEGNMHVIDAAEGIDHATRVSLSTVDGAIQYLAERGRQANNYLGRFAPAGVDVVAHYMDVPEGLHPAIVSGLLSGFQAARPEFGFTGPMAREHLRPLPESRLGVIFDGITIGLPVTKGTFSVARLGYQSGRSVLGGLFAKTAPRRTPTTWSMEAAYAIEGGNLSAAELSSQYYTLVKAEPINPKAVMPIGPEFQLAPPRYIPNEGGFIRSFVTTEDQVFYRVYSNRKEGPFLIKVPPKSREYAIESLALPPGNKATYIQEVHVPKGTRLQRSRARPIKEFGRKHGGAEQFEVLNIKDLEKLDFKTGVLFE